MVSSAARASVSKGRTPVGIALEIADRAYLLEAGQIVRAGIAKDWRSDPEISKVYLGG
ncbi:MAG: hypothetical protein WBB01_00440 [Phormidesmis sp.]